MGINDPILFFALMVALAFVIAAVWQLIAPDSRRVRVILGSAAVTVPLVVLLSNFSVRLFAGLLFLVLLALFAFAVALVGAGPGAILGGYVRRRVRRERENG